MIILNNGDPTRFNSGNGNFSAIDLTFSNSSFSHQLNWQVIPQIYSSDHIPILITIYKKNHKNKNSLSKRWNLKNPNWTLFSSIIEEDVKQINSNNTDILSMVSLLTETIISAAKKSIGECTLSLLNHRVPWWNKEISDIITIKKKSTKKISNYKRPFRFHQSKNTQSSN
uniref:Endonuclease/exonuclease/phosphatase domain-containing protein n=1 Tax=Sipha flava TaxID=143950 RepID=A0A2S2QBU7_9HEMI